MEAEMSTFLTYITPLNMLTCFLGTAIGITFGAIPGLTAPMGVALFLSFTFGMDPIAAFGLLLGIYCGGTYGGSITAILIRTPGSPASAATVMDGYPMAQKGKAAKALSMAVTASCIGGLFSCVILMLVAPQLARFALKFGPPEYFAVGLFGLSIVASLASNNLKKGILTAMLGLCLTTIGIDPISGNLRFTFGIPKLIGGIKLIPVLIGVFAVSEVFMTLEKIGKPKEKHEEITSLGSEGLTLKDLKNNIWNLFRSAVVGTCIGIIPATGATISGWISYNLAKNTSKHPDEFGKGTVEGVVASETANNAVTGGALIPLLTLGIPGDVVTAILMGALMIQGMTPGPTLFTKHADVITGIYLMLIAANIFMLIIGLIGIRQFVKVLKIPTNILMPIVLMLCLLGSYATTNSVFDVLVTLVMGLVGFLLRKMDYPMPPLLLGMVLGNLIEANFRRALTMSLGDYSIFTTRPICFVFILVSVFACILPTIQAGIRKRKTAKAAGGR